ncbi:hypothetical protein Phum_PHUM492210 [Pediculus humanus corporis]|uniref:Uncharacterized protein n=1 Tax=Pediculus humanus subsp. corporis TaxID=121224 RepID=E0VWY6_PEDHC|nr:uncharacterized protein Phum_PHUM492210 [Pediculus humanus corporis]EEB17892.1 hypothetical protein Phum_PHUM492210 [Pediculus humanus corporis]
MVDLSSTFPKIHSRFTRAFFFTNRFFTLRMINALRAIKSALFKNSNNNAVDADEEGEEGEEEEEDDEDRVVVVAQTEDNNNNNNNDSIRRFERGNLFERLFTKMVTALKQIIRDNFLHDDDKFEIELELESDSRIFNVIETWLTVLYCTLLLRTRFVNYLENYLKENNMDESKIGRQLLQEESMNMYKMIRKAQARSHIIFNHLKLRCEKNIVERADVDDDSTDDGIDFFNTGNDKNPTFDLTTATTDFDDDVDVDDSAVGGDVVNHVPTADNNNANVLALIEKILNLKKDYLTVNESLLLKLKFFNNLMNAQCNQFYSSDSDLSDFEDINRRNLSQSGDDPDKNFQFDSEKFKWEKLKILEFTQFLENSIREISKTGSNLCDRENQ